MNKMHLNEVSIVTVKAILIPVDGPIQFIELDNDGIKAHVDGWLEGLRVASDLFAYIDEEGKPKNKPINERATRLCSLLGTGLRPDDFLVGNVVLTGTADADGENTDVPEKYNGIINLI